MPRSLLRPYGLAGDLSRMIASWTRTLTRAVERQFVWPIRTRGIVIVKYVWFLALVLAWPTMGLSLLAIPVCAILGVLLQRKVRDTRSAYLAAQHSAMESTLRGETRAPSWIRNKPLQQQFVLETTKAAIEAGMTAEQARSWFAQQDVVNCILTAAACFEKEGFRRFEQIVGASDLTKTLAREQLKEQARKASMQDDSEDAPDYAWPGDEPDKDGLAEDDGGYKEGRRLFEEGMAFALQYKSREAIDCYTRSIEVCENPAPYINRANLLSKRIRHYEAMQDLLVAQRLDFASEFSDEIERELEIVSALTKNYRNGVRETLVKPSEVEDPRAIAEAILRESFGLKRFAWENAIFGPLIEFHFFNELDNIAKFDDLNGYPEVERWLKEYPAEFIAMKVESCPDFDAYRKAEFALHTHLCSYDERDMQPLRRHVLYDIHRKLMTRDFGGFWDALSSECRGITKEAEEFMAGRA